MPGNFKKEDLRVTKTYKFLLLSMNTLLRCRNFEKITVNDLCKEALISRVTFYAHFDDKYDLLKYWLDNIREKIIKDMHKKGKIKIDVIVNRFIYDNTGIITNLITNANNEILELLHDFMYSVIEITIIKRSNDNLSYNQIQLANFCAGGMANLLKLQVKNKFPQADQVVNSYFIKMLEILVEWDSRQIE